MLRPYFLHHHELLGDTARLAYDAVRQMTAAVVDEPDARPGMLGVIQTFASSLKWNPHIHSIIEKASPLNPELLLTSAQTDTPNHVSRPHPSVSTPFNKR